MEITTRQHERMKTCAIMLEEACEKNNVALRAVRLIREQLDDIETDADPEGMYDWQPDVPEVPEVPEVPDILENADGTPAHADIRNYGQELMAGGCGIKELINMVMEHFGLTQTAFANLIGVNQGNISEYLRFGYRRDRILKAVTEFFGFDGKAGA